MNRKLIGTAAIVVSIIVFGAAAAISGGFPPAPAEQPIRFNHKLHLAQDMTCTDCHKTVEKAQYASFPTISQCMLCHAEAQGKDPEEPKVREYAEKGEEIPWVQQNRLPGHVYFSHAMHTKLAKLDCKTCHGDMKDRTEPVTHSQITNLTMSTCMACHKKNGMSNDCMHCHK